jgi:hypothetical protein
VLSYLVMETAAGLASGTVPTFMSVAISIHVHVMACTPVAHLRTKETMVIDLVVQSRKISRRQTALLVSAPHNNVKKARQPKQTVVEAKSIVS